MEEKKQFFQKAGKDLAGSLEMVKWCNFDHTIIPENERELCFHKNACTYKPHCIFLHPEGQVTEGWQQTDRKVSRVCRLVVNGGSCSRSVCNFFHPHYGNVSKKKIEFLHQVLNSFLRLGV